MWYILKYLTTELLDAASCKAIFDDFIIFSLNFAASEILINAASMQAKNDGFVQRNFASPVQQLALWLL